MHEVSKPFIPVDPFFTHFFGPVYSRPVHQTAPGLWFICIHNQSNFLAWWDLWCHRNCFFHGITIYEIFWQFGVLSLFLFFFFLFQYWSLFGDEQAGVHNAYCRDQTGMRKWERNDDVETHVIEHSKLRNISQKRAGK